MNKNNIKVIQAFLYTIEEYKKFNFGESQSRDTDDYNSNDYKNIMFKLLLLRKYFAKKDKVNIEKVIEFLKTQYLCEELIQLENQYEYLKSYNFTLYTSNGTKLDFYKVVEDVMYGLFLHADLSKIERISVADEKLVFITIRKYIEMFEPIVLGVYEFIYKTELYDQIKQYHIDKSYDVASVIKTNDDGERLIKNNEYYTNFSGKDATIDDAIHFFDEEKISIYNVCYTLLSILNLKSDLVTKLDTIFTMKVSNIEIDSLKEHFNGVEWGISSNVSYVNTEAAKVKLLKNTHEPMIINGEHINTSVTFIYMIKVDNIWKIDKIKF